jgi:hypothetical protein
VNGIPQLNPCKLAASQLPNPQPGSPGFHAFSRVVYHPATTARQLAPPADHHPPITARRLAPPAYHRPPATLANILRALPYGRLTASSAETPRSQ